VVEQSAVGRVGDYWRRGNVAVPEKTKRIKATASW